MAKATKEKPAQKEIDLKALFNKKNEEFKQEKQKANPGSGSHGISYLSCFSLLRDPNAQREKLM